jgi:hypothetical protein
MEDAGGYDVIIVNAARPAGVRSGRAQLTVLVDSDGDRIPDEWETAERGLDPEDPSDGELDFDGDGLSNREEYDSGTDPNDAQSVLKVEEISAGEGGVRILFNAVKDKSYAILYRDRVDGGDWLTLTNVPAGGLDRVEMIIDAAPVGSRFYRLVTPARE